MDGQTGRSHQVQVAILPEAQRVRAAQSFVTRRVPKDAMATILSGGLRPRSGDVVLARISRLGNHRHIEHTTGRRGVLHVGDDVILAYADRYATDQYESYVPRTIGRTHLVASGGIASRVASRSVAVRAATEIVPLGLIGDHHGRPINVADYALPRIDPRTVRRPRTIAVFGTTMNAGKTTTIHQMLHGLARAGARPGSAKVTGTGSGNDYWQMIDAGAHRQLDFTDAGMSSTFQHGIERLEDAAEQLVAHLTAAGCGINFLEIADGVYQHQNMQIIRSPRFHALIDAVVFAGADAMGAVHGVQALQAAGFTVAAVSGTLTKSALNIRETTDAIGLPVFGLTDLADARIMAECLGLDTSDLVLPSTELEPWQIVVPGLIDATGASHADDDDDSRYPLAETGSVAPEVDFTRHFDAVAVGA